MRNEHTLHATVRVIVRSHRRLCTKADTRRVTCVTRRV